jgi:hypothetical protein
MIDTNAKRVVRKAKRWLKEQIVQDVPEDIALCEFDCRKGQCRVGEWESCERRLKDLQDLRRWKTRNSDCDQLSLSTDKTKEAVSNGGTGKRQGDAEGRLVRRVAARTKAKQ